MSSTSTVARFRDWATTQRQITIVTSIIVAVPTMYLFQAVASGDDLAGSFFLVMTLAVGVPSAYDDYWPQYEQMGKAIAWVVIACLVATIEFTSLYLVGTEFVDISPLIAPVGAFLVTYFGNFVWLSARNTA